MLISCLSGDTCLAGVTIYAIKETQLHFDGHHRNRTLYQFDWSFALTCGGGAMALVCAMSMACELRKGLAVNRHSGYQSIPDSCET
ncbi:hypothetical protein DPMN_071170 [Dreissena polymorpha]|uniref:Uncharacterized protein n=1 Tax=Dreissena polymorpha TaxID=45954 RepID=A0A9D3Z699_DREPO|nr:hypothetical protein DPMN_071170 [Dreissena polymorpha]